MALDIFTTARVANRIVTAFATQQTDIITVDYTRKPTIDRVELLDFMGVLLEDLGSHDTIIPVEATYHAPDDGEPTLNIPNLPFAYPLWTTDYDPRLHAAVIITSDDVPQWRIDLTDEMIQQITDHVKHQFTEVQPNVKNPYTLDSIFVIIP